MPDDFLRNSEKLPQPIQMQLSKKTKNFLSFFPSVSKIYNKFLKYSKKQMAVIPYVFPKLQTPKDLIRQISKEPLFRTPFESQHVKGWQTFLKSAWQHFHHNSSLWRKLSWKRSLLVICEVLGIFVNTLTADDKYSHCNSENLQLLIQMQLSKEQKSNSELWVYSEIYVTF